MSVTLVLLAAYRQTVPQQAPLSSPQPVNRRRAASTSSRRSVSSTYSPRLSTSRAAPAVITSDQSTNIPDSPSYFTSPAPSPPRSRLASPGIPIKKSSLVSPDPLVGLESAPEQLTSIPSAVPSSLSANASPFIPPMRRNVSNSQRSIRTASSRRGSDASRSSISDVFRPGVSAAPAVTTTSNESSIGLGSAPASRMSASGRSSRASSVSEISVGALGEISTAQGSGQAIPGPAKLQKKSSFSLPFTRRSASGTVKDAANSAEVAAMTSSGGTLGERLKRSLSGRK